MSRRTARHVGVLCVGLLIVAVVLVARSFTYVPLLGDDPNTVYAADSLPDRLHVCGRSWSRSRNSQSRQQILDSAGLEPTIVSPRQFSACPAGACSTVAGGPCTTVIFARVGPDAFIAYSLSGGP